MQLDGIQIWPALIIGLILGYLIANKKNKGTWL